MIFPHRPEELRTHITAHEHPFLSQLELEVGQAMEVAKMKG